MKINKNYSTEHILKKLEIMRIEPDLSILDDSEKRLVDILIECGKIINKIYLIQKYHGNLKVYDYLKKENNEKIFNSFKLMSSPFDVFTSQAMIDEYIENNTALYPIDLTIEEWDSFIEANEELSDDLVSPYTVVIRSDKGLTTIPYSEFFKSELSSIIQLLEEAITITENFYLKNYLKAQINAFETNDYSEADIRWLQIEDCPLEILIGPYEFYEDNLMGYKTFFTSFIALKNNKQFKKMKLIKKLITFIEDNIPLLKFKTVQKTKNDSSEIEIVDLIYNSGDGRGPIPTAAFNLPNSQKIRSEFGSKKVIIYNIIEAKFNSVTVPIAERIYDSKTLKYISFNSYFNHILLHELSHEIGNILIKDKEKEKEYEISYFLKDLYPVLEELKADVMGLFSLFLLITNSYITDCTVNETCNTYLIGLLRNIRFGGKNSHSIASIIQWNYLFGENIIMINNEKIEINLHKIEKSIDNFLTTILNHISNGDYNKCEIFIEKYSKIDDELLSIISLIDDLPIDILTWYPAAGEEMPFF